MKCCLTLHVGILQNHNIFNEDGKSSGPTIFLHPQQMELTEMTWNNYELQRQKHFHTAELIERVIIRRVFMHNISIISLAIA